MTTEENWQPGDRPLKLISEGVYRSYEYKIYEKIDGTFLGLADSIVSFSGTKQDFVWMKIQECINYWEEVEPKL